MGDEQQFNVVVQKTQKGFGIYFTKVAIPDGGCEALAVDGLVEDSAEPLEDFINKEALTALNLGDILTGVNGEYCEGKEVADILGLLRAAAIGPNTLSFSRSIPVGEDPSTPSNVAKTLDLVPAVEAPKNGIMGALLKVKSKIQAEMDGDQEELLHEQLEDERFQKQWLEEFERFRKQYAAKWETCTYTADEFCGLLYRSSDAQQKSYLLHEYPTLMEAWKDGHTSSSSSRVVPEWPAVKLTYNDTVEYDPHALLSAACDANPRSIHCSHALQSALDCLRLEFMWRSIDLQAFSRCLDAAGISSCSGLLDAMNARSCYFERNFQSTEYPRLSKSMIRALRRSVEHAVTCPSRLDP
ncbi:hypothetical protein P3T76_013838 [Phytophthora citrophthora]|uniref:PDZ domain-containing protein n=1 Tax=Phytophthora citrophthora TaxID=4793 RepID=A0AAD9LBP3_9STRA|nr:hypothetical protein P3T76_013838 [Phytophthora citrophthora]